MSKKEEDLGPDRRQALQKLLGIGAGLAVPAEWWTPALGASPQTAPARPGNSPFRRILLPKGSHPAVISAAKIIASKLGLPESAVRMDGSNPMPRKGELVLAATPVSEKQRRFLGAQAAPPKFDGYVIGFRDQGALVAGNRPRSLLYAAGDLDLWRNQQEGAFLREPSFELRVSHGSRGRTIAESVAELGANVMQGVPAVATLKQSFPDVFNRLSHDDQDRLLRAQSAMAERSKAILEQCRDADVPVYTSIYGNNFEHWSPALYQAVIETYPSTKGTPEAHSWEKCPLCPSDPMTWKIIDAYIRELMERSGADGFVGIFWDQYGMFCHDERCVRDGLNKFPNEVYVNVQQLYDTVVRSMGKGLIVRTWSSGCPHWLGDEYVHAPGYGGFGGTGEELWGRVIHGLPAEIMLQTKVYNSDVEPNPPFSPLIGAVKPHPQIAEYQIIGQTTGRYYFPASSVNYTAWTMKKARELIGPTGGVALGYGATMQPDFSLPDDIVNGINLYAARELSWNLGADMETVWSRWATPIYGPEAAPHIIKALQLSEDAANLTFSVLGLGSSTNSNFVGSVARKETLLRYTNRFDLPEYAKYLEPTKENIALVIAEKQKCREGIQQMFQELELAKPHLTPAQAEELETRFNWFREFAICRQYHDISLWRYRYLRYLATQLTTEPEQMKYLAEAYDQVAAHHKLLFQYDPKLKFSCYDRPLGELLRKPDLGDPMPVMKELYDESRKLVEQSVGPDYLPAEWIRD